MQPITDNERAAVLEQLNCLETDDFLRPLASSLLGGEAVPADFADILRILERPTGLRQERVGDVSTVEGRKFLMERSPLAHVDKIQKPLLISQGANDPRVNQVEKDQIVKAMKDKNLPVTYVLYPDEGHGFQRPENNLSVFAVTEQFLNRCLGGRAETIGKAFDKSSIQVPEGAGGISGLAEALKEKK
jgi:hypothetical protein